MMGFFGPGVLFGFAFVIVVLVAVLAPRCAPGDHSGTTIGGVMLLQGCR